MSRKSANPLIFLKLYVNCEISSKTILGQNSKKNLNHYNVAIKQSSYLKENNNVLISRKERALGKAIMKFDIQRRVEITS